MAVSELPQIARSNRGLSRRAEVGEESETPIRPRGSLAIHPSHERNTTTGTTEIQSRSANDARAVFWKLDHLRAHLDATAEEYAAAGPPLDGVAETLDFTIECIAEVQA